MFNVFLLFLISFENKNMTNTNQPINIIQMLSIVKLNLNVCKFVLSVRDLVDYLQFPNK